MNDVNTTTAPAETTATKIIARLVIGRYYDYKGKVWDRDAAQAKGQRYPEHEVTAAERDYLEEHAVLLDTVKGREIVTPRFEFFAEGAEPDKQTRRRPRSN